jgi:hypothetical protein
LIGCASRREPQPGVGEPVILNVSRHQRVLSHGGNQARQLDVDAFVLEEAAMNRHEKRQVAHGITRQRKLDLVGAQCRTRWNCQRANAQSKNDDGFMKNLIVHSLILLGLHEGGDVHSVV